jgi:PAS domain S-box-containing protein
MIGQSSRRAQEGVTARGNQAWDGPVKRFFGGSQMLISEPELRRMARARIKDGRLACNPPSHVRGGQGTGYLCDLCGESIRPDKIEFEVQLIAARPSAHRLHLRCYEVWLGACDHQRERSLTLIASRKLRLVLDLGLEVITNAGRRLGFRGAPDVLNPPAPPAWPRPATDSVLMAPDAPLAEPADVDPRWSDTQLLEYTHDAIIIWEMQGQGILYWNRAAEQLYGYSRGEVRGRTTHELLKTELVGGVTRLENSLARFGIWAGELRHTTRSGRKVDVEGRLAVMSQHNGRWLVLEVNRDITDRKAAEAARQSMEHQLAELRSLRGAPHEADR